MIEIVHPKWESFQLNLVEKAGDMSTFKTWEGVLDVPLYSYDELTEEYWNDIQNLLKKAQDRFMWNKLLEKNESETGHSMDSWKQAQVRPYGYGPTTSMRLKSIHHILTYHVLSERFLSEYNTIVEFGAGIGETAHAVMDMGFTGRYCILDLPVVKAIAKFYLQDHKNVVFLKGFPKVDKLLPEKLGKTLFISTWALSEVPLTYREEAANFVRDYRCDHLILFQKEFQEINNTSYFIDMWPFVTKSFYRIKQMHFHSSDGGNVYLVGKAT